MGKVVQSELVSEEKISILIPTYNREKYIEETIFSALNQTYKNIEVIIVDNCSTDGTYEICQKIASKDARLLLFKNSENIGPVKNWIECLKKSSGKYVKILWSDDLMHPEFLRQTMDYIVDDNVGFVYTAVKVFGTHDDVKDRFLYQKKNTGIYKSDQYIQGVILGGDYPVSPGCALFRHKDVVNNLKAYIPNPIGSNFSEHGIGSDLLLFLLTAMTYKKYAVINKPYSFFRAHADSITIKSGSDKTILFYDLTKRYFLNNIYKNKKLISKFNGMYTYHCLKNRNGYKKYGVKKISMILNLGEFIVINIAWVVRQIIK